jgi:hypothetical protein
MAGVYLNYVWILTFFSVGLLELFFFQHFTQYRFNTLQSFKQNTAKNLNILGSNIQTTFTAFWHVFAYLTLKISPTSYTEVFNYYNVYLVFFILLHQANNSLFQDFYLKKISIYQSSNLFLFFLVYLYTACTDFITMLLIVETITTLYYFFFLKHSANNSVTLLKYKNLISYYLWLSFFTLLFFVLNLFYWVYTYGTLDFDELQNIESNSVSATLILVAFFWKLGVPAFHFFKLELYRYLDFGSLVLFSTLSLTINTLIFIYLLNVLNCVLTYNLFIFVAAITFNIIILVQSLDKIFLFYFLAISSLNTWVFFLIISLS